MGEVLTVFLGVVGAGVIGLSEVGGVVVLPLLATQILWINPVSDSWLALAMGVDPPTDDVMARKPRWPSDRLTGARMWAGVIQIGLVVAIVTLLTIDLYLPGGLIEGTHDLATARTAGFTVLVLAHLFNAINARRRPRVRSRICLPTRGFGARSHCRYCCRLRWSTSPSLTLRSARRR